MDKRWKSELAEEAAALGLSLAGIQLDALALHADLLAKWNQRLNLTAIGDPEAVRIKHFVDSLAGLSMVPSGAASLLDLGSGAGFPGVPWLVARPTLRATLVDAVAKKVGFVKTVLAQVAPGRGRAAHVRAAGHPEAEGLPRADVVVARALTDLEAFLTLAHPYVWPGGCVVAMLGGGGHALSERVAGQGFELEGMRSFELPQGLGQRTVLRAVPRETR